jgi:Fic family protein
MKSFKSGTYISHGSYRSFQPEFINRQWKFDDSELQTLLSKAAYCMGQFDMYSRYIPNIDMFISMHILKEATQSSRIEGTQTNMEEALLEKEDIPVDRRDEWQEVQNYVAAMNHAVQRLTILPLSSRLLRETHQVLLQGVRGEHKQPGKFRTSQNWIGGSNINDAVFIPPVHTSVGELVGDIEKFIHNDTVFVPELLKIAIVHYQFETIHPFLDGNGRVGRLLITLYLVSVNLLKRPILYLSDYFERNRNQYYSSLTQVREKNDIVQWLKFFLRGVIDISEQGIDTLSEVMQLQRDVDEKIQSLKSKTHNAKMVVNHLYQHPMIDVSKVVSFTGLSNPSAYKLIADMERLGILTEMTGGKRSKCYVFQSYLNAYRK